MHKILSFLLSLTITLSSYAFTATDKPIQVIVPFAPGGTVDIIFREFQLYATSKGITMIGLYKPGALGVIGLQELTSSTPDGNSIALSLIDSVAAYKISTGKVMNPDHILFLHQSVFAFVVKADSNLNSVEDVVAKMKENKKGVSIGFSTPIQGVITTEVFVKQAKVSEDRVILVNYGKGGAQIISDVIGGHLDIGLAALAQFDSQIKAGKLKAIAVDSTHRLKLYPEVHTLISTYPKLPPINRGICLLINTSTPEQVAFWKKFVSDYKESPRFIARESTEFYEIKTLSPADITKTILENETLLRTLQAKE